VTDVETLHSCSQSNIMHKVTQQNGGGVPWLRHLFASPGFNPVTVHVRFMVDKITQSQVPLQVLQFSLASIVPSLLYTLYRHYITQAPDRASLSNTFKINKKEGNITVYTAGCGSNN
jgi:hypothetical protein